jgi:poly [ADP-ribose] polymerase
LDLSPANVTANNQSMIDHTNAYYSQIPHSFGRNRPSMIVTEEQLKREIELLDSLSDMKIAEEIIKEAKSKHGDEGDMHPLDRKYAGLGMSEMTPLCHKSKEFSELETYLQGTRGQTHSIKYEVEDIFRIERSGEYVLMKGVKGD